MTFNLVDASGFNRPSGNGAAAVMPNGLRRRFIAPQLPAGALAGARAAGYGGLAPPNAPPPRTLPTPAQISPAGHISLAQESGFNDPNPNFVPAQLPQSALAGAQALGYGGFAPPPPPPSAPRPMQGLRPNTNAVAPPAAGAMTSLRRRLASAVSALGEYL